MESRKLKTLYKKELLDVIRDKKTVLTMIVLPLILYPVIFLVALKIVTFITMTQQEQTYYIAYENVEKQEQNKLDEWIAGDEDGLEYVISSVESKDVQKDLLDEKIDAYITTNVTEKQVIYEVHYLSAISNSSAVSGLLEEEIEALAKHCAEVNAKEAGYDVEHVLYPVKTKLMDCSSNESSLGSILGSIIPFLMITSILMGAMYPAIDATAGEKERGTLETLLTLPVNNLELIMSKFFSVATIAMVSVLINVISIGGVAAYLYATVNALSQGIGEFHFASFLPAILISIVCVMAFALFMSAVVMCICAFAKSFKEANNYISPLMIVIVLIAYIGFIPNIELTEFTAFIPVANICLLMKSLLIFKYNFSLIFIVLFSNILYAFLSVTMLAKVYNTETILFGESLGGMQLFEKRENIKKGGVPSIGEGLLVLIIALLLLVYLGGLLSVHNMVVGVIVPQIFIGILPIVLCWYTKSDAKKVFKLSMPKGCHLLASVCMWLGAGSGALLIGNLLNVWFPSDSESLNDEYMAILDGLPFGCAILLMAALPAICEEIMYRGLLLAAFRKNMNVVKAIVIVSFLFGMSHLSVIKFIPTMLLGIALAYAVEKSGSIVSSAIIHLLNNGFSVFVLYYGKKISWLNDKQAESVMIMVMICLCIIATSVAVILFRKKDDYEKSSI